MLKISSGQDWTFEKLEEVYEIIEEIAVNKYKLELYPNQIEIISSEQMLEQYTSHGLPIFYNHWSLGESFVKQQNMYHKGHMGLAFEIVINTDPAISYCMQDNTMTMQALVLAHAACGHNHFFKNNYLFKQWTAADAIIDYLKFAKKYIADCEEKYGPSAVEATLDAAHALQHFGVDKYKRSSPLNAAAEQLKQREREEFSRQHHNELWKTIPNTKAEVELNKAAYMLDHPEENILYFLEKNAPTLETWQREVIRIVRKIGQYFFPQMQTKISNEGFACVTGNTLVDTPNGLMRASDIVNTQYNGTVFDGEHQQTVSQWYSATHKKRVRITTSKGYTIHGGSTHRILCGTEWVQLQNLNVGDFVNITPYDSQWPTNNVQLSFTPKNTKDNVKDVCKKVGVNVRTYYKWKNKTGNVLEQKTQQCEEVERILVEQQHLNTKDYNRRIMPTFPSELNEEFAFFLGLMIGDGNIHQHRYGNFCLTSGDVSLRDWFSAYCTNVLNLKTTVRPDRNHWKVIVYSQHMIDFLIDQVDMCTGTAAARKRVPEKILTSPKNVVAAFLRGHADTDGCATTTGSIVIVSKSKELLTVEQQLLLKFGIMSSIRLSRDGTYKLSMHGKNAAIFSTEIGFSLNRKQEIIDVCNTKRQWFCKQSTTDVITTIEYDEGLVYDFGVENSHRYCAGGFVNHNCYTHHKIMNDLYDKGVLDDGAMLEFLHSHTSVIAQPPYNSKYFSGFNPYAIGFAIYQDIERVCMNPTDEDRRWFAGQDWVGSQNYVDTIKWAVANFKDESFIQQFISPKVIRDFKMFVLHDDYRDTKYEIAAIQNERGYDKIVDALVEQTSLSYYFPDIQVVGYNKWSDRELILKHTMVNERPLDVNETLNTLRCLSYLWGTEYPVTLESVKTDPKNPLKDKVVTVYEIYKGETKVHDIGTI